MFREIPKYSRFVATLSNFQGYVTQQATISQSIQRDTRVGEYYVPLNSVQALAGPRHACMFIPAPVTADM